MKESFFAKPEIKMVEETEESFFSAFIFAWFRSVEKLLPHRIRQNVYRETGGYFSELSLRPSRAWIL